MNLKLVIAISLVTAAPGVAFAQKDAPAAPKATVADVQKVVQIIGADKAKLQAWCELNSLQDQMAAADQKHDQKTLEALSAKADALSEKVGPEYTKLMGGLEDVDPDSAEGKQFDAAFDSLGKQCK
jgi:hypothetical protein